MEIVVKADGKYCVLIRGKKKKNWKQFSVFLANLYSDCGNGFLGGYKSKAQK